MGHGEVTAADASSPHPYPLRLMGHVSLAGFANAAGQTVGHPFDLLKLRMQVQGAGTRLTRENRRYQGAWHGLRVIYLEEGAVGLFSAWRISAAREWWYSGLRVGLYEPVKELFGATDPSSTPLHTKILSGVVTGTIASTLSNPLDLLKVRYQAAIGADYKALPPPWVELHRLYKQGGRRALWRGYVPNTARAAGITAVQLSSYDHIKHFLLNTEVLSEGRPLHLISSAIASVLCILATNPVDVLKTRLMNQQGEAQSMRSCALSIFRTEGFGAFYKGAFLAWLRLGPHTVVTFTSFELLRRWFGIKPL